MRYEIDDSDDEDGVPEARDRAIQDYIYDEQGERRIYFVAYNRLCGRDGVLKQLHNMR